jgi:hypothetical protein
VAALALWPALAFALSGNGVNVADGLIVLPQDVCAAPSMTCDGVTNDSTALAVAATVRVGAEVYIPPKKTIVIGSIFSVPDGTTVRCGPGGTIKAAGRVCVGGTNAGSYCSGSGHCRGGTCTGTPFAPTGGTTYTMIGAAGGASRISIIGCTIDANQYDPNNAATCSAGTNVGDACKHECIGFPGYGCDANADCIFDCPSGTCTTGACVGGTRAGLPCGTCTNLTDCETASPTPGDCSGESAAPSGAGKIIAIDASGATTARLVDNEVINHRRGTSVITGNGNVRGIGNARTMDISTFPIAIGGPAGALTVAVDAGLKITGAAKAREVDLRGTTYGIQMDGTKAAVNGGAVTALQAGGIGVWQHGSAQRTQNLDIDAEQECVRIEGAFPATYGTVSGNYCTVSDYHEGTGVNVEAGGQYNIEGDFAGVFNPVYVNYRAGNVNIGSQSRIAFGCGPKVVMQSFGVRVNAPYEAWESGGCGYCPGVTPMTICDVVDYCPGGTCTGSGGTLCVGGVKNGLACKDTCAAGSCVPFPDILVGTWKPKMIATAHGEVRGGILHTSVANTSLVAATPPAKRCTGGKKGLEICTTSSTTDCPHMCGAEALNAGTQCSANSTCTCDSHDDCGVGGTCSAVPGPGTCSAGTICGGGNSVLAISPVGGTCSAVSHTDLAFSDLKILSASNGVIGYDFSNFGANTNCVNCTVGGSEISFAGTSTVGMKFPTDQAGLVNFHGAGIHFANTVVDKLLNWSYAFGTIEASGPLNADDPVCITKIYTSGGAITAGDNVEIGSTDRQVVQASAGEANVLGVALQSAAGSGTDILIATQGCKVYANITDVTLSRGARLSMSATAGKLAVTSSSAVHATAIADESYTSGGDTNILVELGSWPGASSSPPPIVWTEYDGGSCGYGTSSSTANWIVRDFAPSGLTGGKVATIIITLELTDSAGSTERSDFRLYRQTSACGGSPECNQSTPSGTLMNGSFSMAPQPSETLSATLMWFDASTATNVHYCLVSNKTSATASTHTVNETNAVVTEYQ